MKNSLKSEYEACINMRIAESQIQWERYNAMLVINTIFIGLVGFTYSTDFEIPLIIKQILSPLGIILCLLWLQMTKRGFMWTTFWTEKAREIEEKYGNKQQINPFIEGKKHKDANEVTFNTRMSSYSIIVMFIIIYLLIFINNILPYICDLCRNK